MRKSTSTIILMFLAVLPCFQAAAQYPSPAKRRNPISFGGKERNPPAVDRLKTQYQVIKLDYDSSGYKLIQNGPLLVVQKPGIFGTPMANLGVAVANFENGALRQPSSLDRMFAGEDTHWFDPGEKVYATKFDVNVKTDRIMFTILAADYTYKAGVHFKFPKGYLAKAEAAQIQEVIGQVLAFDTGADNDANSTANNDAGPAPPAPGPQFMQQPQGPQPMVPPQTADGIFFDPIIVNGQLYGYTPPGTALAPAGRQPQPVNGFPYQPLSFNGQIIAYAPPGSVLLPQVAPQAPAMQLAAPVPPTPAAPGYSASSSTKAEPQTIRLGQTGEEVQAILGTPDKIANLGPKVIFIYRDLKVILMNGKVTDVQ